MSVATAAECGPLVEIPSRLLFGIPIARLTTAQTVALCDQVISQRRRLLIGVVNAAKVVKMERDAALRRAVLAADLILADGMAIVWAARVLRQPLPERVAGIDLMLRLLALGDARRYRVYCLGATQEVLGAVVRTISCQYPGVQLVGQRDGYFDASDEPQVAADIASAGPDLLFVGMSSPKKEQFLARWSPQLGVPVCHGVGGSFDVLAGKVKRAPELWQRAGLEWLYRVLQEPRRMWRRYLLTNTAFCALLLREAVAKAAVARSAHH